MGRKRIGEGEPTIVKKYTNRRLYDTGRSSYVTLDDLGTMIKEGHHFIVHDIKTGHDITHQILLQIVQEKETVDTPLLSTAFLRELIYFYGDETQPFLRQYLEQRIIVYVRHIKKLRSKLNPGNLSIFEQAIKSWPSPKRKKSD